MLRYTKALAIKGSLVSTTQGISTRRRRRKSFLFQEKEASPQPQEDSRKEEDIKGRREGQPTPLLSSLLTPFFTSDLEDNSKGKPQP